jgi:hypothetical protein
MTARRCSRGARCAFAARHLGSARARIAEPSPAERPAPRHGFGPPPCRRGCPISLSDALAIRLAIVRARRTLGVVDDEGMLARAQLKRPDRCRCAAPRSRLELLQAALLRQRPASLRGGCGAGERVAVLCQPAAAGRGTQHRASKPQHRGSTPSPRLFPRQDLPVTSHTHGPGRNRVLRALRGANGATLRRVRRVTARGTARGLALRASAELSPPSLRPRNPNCDCRQGRGSSAISAASRKGLAPQ